MAIRAFVRKHPHIAALVTAVLALLIWGWLLPWVWHQPRDWAATISMSVVLGSIGYFNRIRSGEIKALILAAISLAALIVYATIVHAHGIPRDATEQFYFAGVVAIPIVGLVLAFWTLRKSRARA
jgi:hypothetical protein